MAVNDDILERAVRHQIFLSRLASHEANLIRGILDDAVPDLLEHIQRRLERISARGFDLGPATTKRLREMAIGITEITDTTYRAAREALKSDLYELAGDEAAFAARSITEALPSSLPITVEMTLPAPAVLRSLVAGRPILGEQLGSWFNGLKRTQKKGIERAVRQGMVQGETIPAIMRRLRGTAAMRFRDGVLPLSRRQAEVVARTAVNHVSSQARWETFVRNPQLIKSVRWVSTLDGDTSDICQRLDGNLYPIDGSRNPPGPPAHPNCRSSIIAITKSWRELGVDAKDMPESTRASMSGQVPAKMKYNEFLRSRVRSGDMSTVKEALGATRAKLFAKGGLDISAFTDRRGRRWTLETLRRRESAAFKRVDL